MNIIDAVAELNYEICEDNPKLCGEGIEFGYHTNGFAEIVNFMGYTVYDSESDIEEDVEAAGGIKQFLIAKTMKYVNMLTKIKVFKNLDSLKFCLNCEENVSFTIKEKTVSMVINGAEFSYPAKLPYCNECGMEIYAAVLDDENIQKANGIYHELAKGERG